MIKKYDYVPSVPNIHSDWPKQLKTLHYVSNYIYGTERNRLRRVLPFTIALIH